MVSVEDFFGLLHVQPLLGALVPRQLQYRVEVVADDAGLGRTRLLLGKALRLLEQLLFRLFGKMQRADLVGVASCVVVLVLAQLVADDMQLLAQIVVALALVHAFLHLVGDLVFQLQNIQLFCQQLHRQLQPPDRMQLLEQLLFILIGKRRILADKIGHVSGIFGRKHLQKALRRILPGHIGKLFKQAVRLPHKRLHAHKRRITRAGVHLHHAAKQIRLRLDAVDKLRAIFALDQNAHIVARQPQNLLDDRHGTELIQRIAFRVVVFQLALGDEKDLLVAADGFFHRAGGLDPADVKMRRHTGKHDQTAQRQHRQAYERLIFTHIGFSFRWR